MQQDRPTGDDISSKRLRRNFDRNRPYKKAVNAADGKALRERRGGVELLLTTVLDRDQQNEGAIAPFHADYAPPDEELAAEFAAGTPRAAAAEERIDARATRLIEAVRARSGGLGGIDDLLHVYSLSTKESLALMALAEALLRIPDAATADRLIEDKLAAGDWLRHERKSTALLASASAWSLGLTARIIQPGETPDNIISSLVKRLGAPAVRAAIRQALRLLGSHFVLAQTIKEAIERARSSRNYFILSTC